MEPLTGIDDGVTFLNREKRRSISSGILAACLFLAILAVLVACAGQKPKRIYKPKPAAGRIGIEHGNASYYANRLHGRKTASGEKYDKNALTAAHRKLPFGTRVRVTNLSNNKSVTVRINDRGPFIKGRIIDLSRAAAEKVGMIKTGVVRVRVEVL